MRQSVFDTSERGDVVLLGGPLFPSGLQGILPDEDAFAPMNSFIDGNLLSMRRLKSGQLQMRSNAGIVSPCGAWIFLDYSPLLNRFEQASVLWAIAGTTKDSSGAALGACRVVATETGRIAIDGGLATVGPEGDVVGETISNGAGAYSIPVAMNTAHQLIAYKAGSPDVAGITRNDVTPAAVG